MSANRVHYFIRSVLQNSKLNREKFVNNKKKHIMTTVKNRNHNMFITRNYGRYIPLKSNGPKKNGPKKNGPNIFIIMVVCVYIVINSDK
jgi:hypothetical protein